MIREAQRQKKPNNKQMGYKSPKRRDTHEEWGVEHIGPLAIWKGLPLKDVPPSGKKWRMGPKKKKRKERKPNRPAWQKSAEAKSTSLRRGKMGRA